jgi:hypothetical protein
MQTLAERKAALKARIDAIEEPQLIIAIDDLVASATTPPRYTPEELAELNRRSQQNQPGDWIPIEGVLAKLYHKTKKS